MAIVRILVILLIGVAAALLVYYSPALMVKDSTPPTYTTLQTGGTSVVSIIMENGWRTAYRKEKGIDVQYASTGTTTGISKMIDGAFAIAFTHGPMTEEQTKMAKSKGGDVVHVPVVLCSVVPVYNVKELNKKAPLRISGEVLADIFLGKIEKWNDPALKKLNEGVDLPDTKITVVHRKDSSGTTLIFTEYLQQVSPVWKEKVGPASSEVKWPLGVGMARNEGVAVHVKKTEGAIGYVDLVHALNEELQHAALQNKDQTAFLQADAPKITAAARGVLAGKSDATTISLINRPGKDSYPICGVIWAICYQSQPATDNAKVGELLAWIVRKGQSFAKKMSYAPLSEELVEYGEEKLKAVKAGK